MSVTDQVFWLQQSYPNDDAAKFTFNKYSMAIILNGSTSKRTQKGE